jgi:hypothetical protein
MNLDVADASAIDLAIVKAADLARYREPGLRDGCQLLGANARRALTGEVLTHDLFAFVY